MKRKRGRPKGTGHAGKWRTTCRKCGVELKKGDPIRNTKYGKRFFGLCRQCNVEKAIIFSWKKKGIRALQQREQQLLKEFMFLRQIEKIVE